jgi:glycosyltransferase involved in cell wall biosynthesis
VIEATRPRLAILSYSNGRFDARTRRVARSAEEAGFDVVAYARWEPGLPFEETVEGLRIVRAPIVVRTAIPGLRRSGRRAIARLRAAAAVSTAAAATGASMAPTPGPAGGAAATRRRSPALPTGGRTRPLSVRLRELRDDPVGYSRHIATRIVRLPYRAVRGLVGPFVLFPLRPMAWAAALEDVAEPADLWHGMWAGSLPALERLRRRHGGRTIYDSRDVYLHARVFDRMRPAMRSRFVRLEQRWARAADLVVTVNDAYADILVPLLGIPRPLVVRNCPDPYDPPGTRPDLIRALVGIAPETAIVLYQGGLMTERGVEQGMAAILEVPGAQYVVMGYGSQRATFVELAGEPRFRGRVSVIDPVPPEELLAWTASADVMLMAIQPTTLNHRYTTPQKLWEAIAAGVPVVASDLPGMAEVVREVGCGTLCDATSPASIAAAVRELLALSPEERAEMRARMLAAAHDRYNWQAQARVLLAAYAGLVGERGRP